MDGFISVILVLIQLIPLIRCGCYEHRKCCSGRDLTCKAVHDPEMARAKSIPTQPERVPDLAEVSGRTSIHKSHDDVWHIHVDPTTNLIPGHGSVQSFVDSLQRMKQKKLARLELSADYDAKILYNDTESIILDLADESVNVTDYMSDYVGEEGDLSNSTLNLNATDSWRFIFGESVKVPSKEYADYDGTDPLIKYVIISDEVPMSLERVSNLILRQTCYCDEVCRTLHDCCHDYNDMCPTVDCIVSDWSGWGYCESAEQCGVGVSKRYRKVIRENLHGGVPCPYLKEEQVCIKQCPNSPIDEVALLLPYKFAAARVPAYNNDIYYDLPRHIEEYNAKRSYCILFTVDWLNPACKAREVREDLRPSSSVCVECQIKYGDRCKGEGLEGRGTFWTLIGHKHCTGKWKQTEFKEDCTCNESFFTTPAYIFV